MTVTLGLVQMSMKDDPKKNVEKALDMIREASRKGAQIVCLPELFNSPYFPQDEKVDASRYAETSSGKTAKALSQAALENRVILVGGSIFEVDGRHFYNTSLVFDQKGKEIGRYRKVHIPHDPNFFEQNYFTAGNEFKVIDTTLGRIAVLICYDQWFPEAARACALMGAQMIFYPTAIGLVDGIEQIEGDWQDAWTTVQRGHAIANGAAVIAVNRVGKERGMRFFGGSFVSSQFGAILAKGDSSEQVIIARASKALGAHVREGWRFFYNRRPDTYGKIVER